MLSFRDFIVMYLFLGCVFCGFVWGRKGNPFYLDVLDGIMLIVGTIIFWPIMLLAMPF